MSTVTVAFTRLAMKLGRNCRMVSRVAVFASANATTVATLTVRWGAGTVGLFTRTLACFTTVKRSTQTLSCPKGLGYTVHLTTRLTTVSRTVPTTADSSLTCYPKNVWGTAVISCADCFCSISCHAVRRTTKKKVIRN